MRTVADDFTAKSSRQDFDLSRNRSIQTLEVPASSFGYVEPGFLAYVVSTIAFPTFPEVIIVYRDYDFGYMDSYGISSKRAQEEASRRRRHFEVLHEVYEVRDFQLVLCADVWDSLMKHAVRVLNQTVAAEEVQRGFDDLFSKLSVTCRPRGSSPRFLEDFGCPAPWFPL